jgi:hypothetical protein
MKCPDCGGNTAAFHGDNMTRIVCAKKCKGWKVIKEIDRLNQLHSCVMDGEIYVFTNVGFFPKSYIGKARQIKSRTKDGRVSVRLLGLPEGISKIRIDCTENKRVQNLEVNVWSAITGYHYEILVFDS